MVVSTHWEETLTDGRNQARDLRQHGVEMFRLAVKDLGVLDRPERDLECGSCLAHSLQGNDDRTLVLLLARTRRRYRLRSGDGLANRFRGGFDRTLRLLTTRSEKDAVCGSVSVRDSSCTFTARGGVFFSSTFRIRSVVIRTPLFAAIFKTFFQVLIWASGSRSCSS